MSFAIPAAYTGRIGDGDLRLHMLKFKNTFPNWSTLYLKVLYSSIALLHYNTIIVFSFLLVPLLNVYYIISSLLIIFLNYLYSKQLIYLCMMSSAAHPLNLRKLFLARKVAKGNWRVAKSSQLTFQIAAAVIEFWFGHHEFTNEDQYIGKIITVFVLKGLRATSRCFCTLNT